MHRQIAGKLTGRVTKWLVLGFWIIVVAAAGPLAGKLTDVQDNQASSWLPASAESTKALDKLGAVPGRERHPDRPGLREELRADQGRPGDDREAARPGPGHRRRVPAKGPDGRIVQPSKLIQVSKDRQVAQGQVTFNFGKDGWNQLPDLKDEILGIAQLPGATVYVAGPGGQAADSAEVFAGIDGKLLYSTVIVVVVILLLTYRSPILWLLPVLSAGVALTTAQGVIYLLAKNAGLTVNGQSQGILTVLVFGAGTDYALLLVARYREELRRHEDRHEAMAFALHRAAPAIVASALHRDPRHALPVLRRDELHRRPRTGRRDRDRGRAAGDDHAAAGAARDLAAAGSSGRSARRSTPPEPTSTGFWAKVGARIAPRPRAGLGRHGAPLWPPAASASCSSTPTACPRQDAYTKDFDSVIGQQVLTDHGLADTASPVMVVANAGQADAVRSAMTGIDGIGDQPTPPIVKGDVALIQAQLESDPTSKAAFATVDDVRVRGAPGRRRRRPRRRGVRDQHRHREGLRARQPGDHPARAARGDDRADGAAAGDPVAAAADRDRGAVVRRARSGLSALLFRNVLGFAGADASLPLFVFVFLVALGIDYNIFLMTRVREETPEHGTRRASLIALGATGGVITSAGLVLAATFAVLATLPLVAFAEIGIAVALGRPARHADRAVGAGHRDQPRRRRQDLVAEQARPGRRADPGRGGPGGRRRCDV